MVLAAAEIKKPPLVPVLAAVAGVAVLAAAFFLHQVSQRGAELVAANASAAQAHEQLTQARERIRELEQEIAAEKTELASALRTLPVEVGFRVGDPGAGYVAHFDNRSTAQLVLTVEPHRSRTGEYGRLEVILPAQGSAELTEKQGWAFRSGDTLVVSAGDFRPVSLAVP